MLSAALTLIVTVAAIAAEPDNMDFEADPVGATPAGWFVPPVVEQGGFRAVVVDSGAHAGKQCVKLYRQPGGGGGFGNLMRSIPAAEYRGQRIRYAAAVRMEGAGAGRAQLWLRVDRAGEQQGFFYNMGDRPITATDWATYEIIGDVADDAESINIGCMLMGDGVAMLDAVSLAVVGETAKLVEAPKPLTDRGLENLTALARVVGYVRHFHPSDEAADADWAAITVQGIRAVESVPDAEQLAARLGEWLRPIAPSVRVYAGKPRPPADDAPLPGDASGLRVLQWRHRGYGGDAAGAAGNIYASRRQSSPAPEGPPAEGSVDPRRPMVFELPGGVTCEVPIAVFADDTGTLPRGQAAAEAAPASAADSGAGDRATRLAGVILAWNVLQHFYPYFDVVETDWPAALRTALRSAAEDADDAAYCDTLGRLAAKLHDGHAGAQCPSDAGGFAPALRWAWIEDRLVITQVAPGALDNLKPGDTVTTIDGRPAAEALADAEQTISAASPQARRHIAAARELRRGPRGSGMVLGIQPGPANDRKEPFTVSVVRSAGLYDLREPRPAKTEEIRPGIWYVDIDRISDDDFRAVLPSLATAKGIVFDLRGYPGNLSVIVLSHLTDKPITCAQWHVPIVPRPDREGMTFQQSNWSVYPLEPRLTTKTAFLTGPGAISYAETYLGIVEHYKLAEIVGESTAGTNGNVNTIRLPGGFGLSFTGMKVLKHDGSRHHGVGIRPTVPCSRTIAGVAAGRDEVLEKGIEVVSGE
jgi:C-terminal processing protease CtpA/Prc